MRRMEREEVAVGGEKKRVAGNRKRGNSSVGDFFLGKVSQHDFCLLFELGVQTLHKDDGKSFRNGLRRSYMYTMCK